MQVSGFESPEETTDYVVGKISSIVADKDNSADLLNLSDHEPHQYRSILRTFIQTEDSVYH